MSATSTRNNSIDPNLWGPFFWHAIHFAVTDYPERDPTEAEKAGFYEFFRSLQWVLPCETCRGHYRAYWETHDLRPALDSQALVIAWALALHNHVNERTGKPVWSLADWQQVYIAGVEEEEKAKELSVMAMRPLPAPRVRRNAPPLPQKKKNTCKNCKRKE
jgi:hypothetical protein